MTFDSYYVLGQLQSLETLIAMAPQHMEALQRAYASPDRAELRRRIEDSKRFLEAMALTTERIQQQIITADELGAPDSLAELLLRAVRMMLLTEVAQLREVIGGPVQVRVYTLPGDWRRCADLSAFVEEQLQRITRRWVGHRPSSCRMAFRLALRDAAHATAQIGRMPQIERFLHDGSARHDWPALAAICTRMRAVFDLRIEHHPNRPLPIYTPRRRDLVQAGQA